MQTNNRLKMLRYLSLSVLVEHPKKPTEKSRECHNHHSQPPTPSEKEKQQNQPTRTKQTNKCTRSTQTAPPPPPPRPTKRGDHNAKRNDDTREQRARKDFKTRSARQTVKLLHRSLEDSVLLFPVLRGCVKNNDTTSGYMCTADSLSISCIPKPKEIITTVFYASH